MLKDLFRGKHKYVTVRPRKQPEQDQSDQAPANLWVKCEGCDEFLYRKELNKNLKVCPKCNHHFRISASERIAQISDPRTFAELDANLVSTDPLEFPAYADKIAASREKTGLNEAVVCGTCTIGGTKAILIVIDFGFMGGSMGSVVGEKVTRGFERAAEAQLPVVVVSSGGGGARMQEGVVSLMQMAKTCQAVESFSRKGLLYVSVLTHPTMGGIYASFGSSADIILAEPNALIGFAGPRLVQETIRQELPRGFQRSEFALENGMIDRIVNRTELRPYLIRVLRLHVGKGEPKRA